MTEIYNSQPRCQVAAAEPVLVWFAFLAAKQDVPFGTVLGTFPLPPGQYTVSISPANTLQGCSNPALLQAL